jgi:hypothetical protein
VPGELTRRQALEGPDALAVESGAEGLLAGTGQHHTADVVVAPQHEPQLAELALHGGVEGVERFGTVEGDPGHAV